MFERFTKPARLAVTRAQHEARELGHSWIGTEHVLMALLSEPEADGVATLVRLGADQNSCREAVTAVVGQQSEALVGDDAEALREFGIDLEEVRRRAEQAFGEGALDAQRDPGERSGPLRRRRRLGPGDRGPGHIPFASRAKKALELALREAIARKDRHIGTEHLALALLRSDDKITTAVFGQLGIDRRTARQAVIDDLRAAA